MKKIIFLVSILQSIISFAQPLGARGSQGRGNQGRPQLGSQTQQSQRVKKPQEFNASDFSGIFYYNLEGVSKKIKIKKDALKSRVNKVLRTYNDKVKEISFLNSTALKEMDVVVNSKTQSLDDRIENRMQIRTKIDDLIRPIRFKLKESEALLNNSLEGVLSEKQFKKWLKYQNKITKIQMPKLPKKEKDPKLSQEN
jgi:ribosomal protein L19